jgi:hypothetical protein
MTKNQKNHNSIANEELFNIEGESQFILAGKMVCAETVPVKKQSWIVRLAKWLRRS